MPQFKRVDESGQPVFKRVDEQGNAVYVAAKQPNVYQDASGKWVDRRAASNPETVAAQAKNHPERQKDETVAAPWYSRLAANVGEGLQTLTDPILNPLDTISANFEAQAADRQRMKREEPLPPSMLSTALSEAAEDPTTIAKYITPVVAGKGLIKTGKVLAPVVRKFTAPVGTAIKTGATSALHGVQDAVRPEPIAAALRAFDDADPAMVHHIPKALSEIKAWEDSTKQTANTAVKQYAAIDNRISTYNRAMKALLRPQGDIVVPGSRLESIGAQIAAIPDDIKLVNPRQYANLVKSIKAQEAMPDFTIKELDSIRKGLGAKNKSYGKDTSGQISASLSTRAIDAALEKFARNKLYDSMDWNAPGSGVDGMELKSRIGAMVNYQDALFKKLNKSIVESSRPVSAKIAAGLGHALRPGKFLESIGNPSQFNPTLINSDLASAARRWKARPEPLAPLKVPFSPSGPNPGVTWKQANPQPELLPTGNPVTEPLLAPPPGTSSTIGQDIFKVQQRADQAARSAPPANVEGVQKPLPGAVPETRLPLKETASFYPGKSGVVMEPTLLTKDPKTGKPYARFKDPETGKNMIDPETKKPVYAAPRDYRAQKQMFALDQGTSKISGFIEDMKKTGLGTRGAQILADLEAKVFTPKSNAKVPSIPEISKVIKSLADSEKIGTFGAERLKAIEAELKAESRKQIKNK